MDSPLISVIIPVYNTEKYLRRCIDSVLSQTIEDFELLLIDDGSTDTSGSICDEYAAKDSRISVFHKTNGGVGSARDLGLDNAKGDYVSFIDSDDWIEKTMFEEMYKMLAAESADFVYCDIRLVSANTEEALITPQFSRDKTTLTINFLNSWLVSLCSIMVRRSLFEIYNIRHPKIISHAEDFHVVIRLLHYAESIGFVDQKLYNYYRENYSSLTHKSALECTNDQRWVYLDTIQFFSNNDMYDKYARVLCWKLLVFLQDYALETQNFDKFLTIHPDKANYIWSCPSLNWRVKIIMWTLTHHLRFVAEVLVFSRSTLKSILCG